MIVPAIFSHARKLNAGIARARKALGRDVTSIHYDLDFDSMGFASIFFKVVLADHASQQPRIREVAQRVALTLMNEVQTDENGVHAYFNFRSRSEAAQLNDPAWAQNRHAIG
jgi:hypothetical protein